MGNREYLWSCEVEKLRRCGTTNTLEAEWLRNWEDGKRHYFFNRLKQNLSAFISFVDFKISNAFYLLSQIAPSFLSFLAVVQNFSSAQLPTLIHFTPSHLLNFPPSIHRPSHLHNFPTSFLQAFHPPTFPPAQLLNLPASMSIEQKLSHVPVQQASG